MDHSKAKKRNRILGWFFVFVLLGLIVWGIFAKSDSSTSSTNAPVDQITENDWYQGNVDAPVVLIEYSDFQCPACGSAYPVVKELKEQYGDDLAFAYRHFPLVSIHPKAIPAAQAAEAAGMQGKFWEMHDKLFDNQSEWSGAFDHLSLFKQYAQELGLDMEKFEQDLTSSEADALVKEDMRSATRSSVNSTPTFFLNGRKLSLQTFTQLKDEVASEFGPTE